MIKPTEETVNGIPHRLLDDYDGDAAAPPEDFIQKLLKDAPPAVRARAEQYAKERAGKE